MRQNASSTILLFITLLNAEAQRARNQLDTEWHENEMSELRKERGLQWRGTIRLESEYTTHSLGG